MIDTCKVIYAEDVQIDDELDLDGDEYGDNELAALTYAEVTHIYDFYHDGEPWVCLTTSQGTINMPASHRVRVKVS